MLDSTCQSNNTRMQLTALERRFVLATQNGLPLSLTPYHQIADQLEISVDEVLTMAKSMQARGVIRRIAIVPNHYKLGYTFNGMTVWDVKDEMAQTLGQQIGALDFVSHCYLRPRHLPTWNYNLFAMVHGRNQQEIDQQREKIRQILSPGLQDHGLKTDDMLTSSRILKKTGLRLTSGSPRNRRAGDQ